MANQNLIVYPFALAAVLALGGLTACSSTPMPGTAGQRAPVEDRTNMPAGNSAKVGGAPAGAAVGSAAAASTGKVSDPAPLPVKLPQGIENAGKPGYYTVKPGDTLIRIGLENGQSWRELARWNQLDSPSRIEVGQVLRVAPPTAAMIAAAAAAPVGASATSGAEVATSSPVPRIPVVLPTTIGAVVPAVTGSSTSTSASAAAASAASTVAAKPAAAVSSAAPSVAPVATADDLTWAWPVKGALLAGFDEVKNKGLDIAGSDGDAVLAAADGTVVYVGVLRGYGNLVILKHNATFLTAYGHNKAITVKEDQAVTRGTKIAEMGQSEADRVKLHFEIRRQGKPVDPAQYLPKR